MNSEAAIGIELTMYQKQDFSFIRPNAYKPDDIADFIFCTCGDFAAYPMTRPS